MITKRLRTASTGLRLVSILEAMKGLLVLLAGCGALSLIHKDLHNAAIQLVKLLHLNPARQYPSIFIDTARHITDLQLWMLALAALVYSAIRLVEAYGLWTQQQWAQWFGLLSGSVYLPVELFEIWREPTLPRCAVLLVNLAVVAYLAFALDRHRRKRRQ